jgi:hypothetical protein
VSAQLNQAEQARQASESTAAASGPGDPAGGGPLPLPSQNDAPHELLRLVSRGLESHSFSVRLPDRADECILTIDVESVIWDLLVGEDGYVEWKSGPTGSRRADPGRIADLAALLLAGRVPDPSGQDEQFRVPDITFLGVVGLEAKARGLDAELETYDDQRLGAVTAEIMLRNPASFWSARVRVDDAPGILWEKDFWPEMSDDRPVPAGQVAEAIISSLVPAIPLARAIFAPGNNPGSPAGQVSAGEFIV